VTPDAWAKAVVDGRRIAGDIVRSACRRHLDDRDRDRHDWDPEPLRRFERLCSRLPVIDRTRGVQVPMRLLDWQRFAIGSILCWTVRKGDRRHRLPGTRRYRRAIIQTAKGSGKSTLAAMLGIYMISRDGRWVDGAFMPEPSPRAYVTGSTKHQAVAVGLGIAVQAARDSLMVDSGALSVVGANIPEKLICPATDGTMEALGLHSQGKGKAGLTPSFVQAEELHEWVDAVQLEVLEAGYKGRPQPLTIELSNVAPQMAGPAWDSRQRAIAACQNGDDGVFGFIAEVDPPDLEDGVRRWWPKPRSWIKANPSIGTTMRTDYIRSRIAEAGDDVYQREEVLRLNFSVWPGAGGRLIDPHLWKAAQVEYVDPPASASCFLGIDLGASGDLTALAIVWVPPSGDPWQAQVMQWLPSARLRQRSLTSTGRLRQWVADGQLAAAGDSVVDLRPLAHEIVRHVEKWDAEICADRWQTVRLRDVMETMDVALTVEKDSGSPTSKVLIAHPQGFAPGANGLHMERSIDAMVSRIVSGQLQVQASPVLDWNLACTEVLVDHAGVRRLRNAFASPGHGQTPAGQIDGLIALVMAVGLADRAITATSGGDNPWEDPEFTWAM